MEDTNKVTVKIFGQEHTISGSLSRDRILQIANYVDMKMLESSKAMPSVPMSSIAVLSAVNITGDYFIEKEKCNTLEREAESLRKDGKQYERLWEEAKSSFIQYKEDAQNSIEQLQELQKLFNEKTLELNRLTNEYLSLEQKYNSQLNKNEELSAKIQHDEEDSKSTSAEMRELEERCKEMENSFFDLQMENIQLKGELDKFKKTR